MASRTFLLAAALVLTAAACDDSAEPSPTTASATTPALPATDSVTTLVSSDVTEAATPTTVAELGDGGRDGLADCAVVIGVIGEVVQHPDTAEAVNAEPALADEPATRQAFDAVAVRFGALELRDPTVAAAAALVAERALDVALAEGTATGLLEPYAEAFVALSDLCAAVADEPSPPAVTPVETEGHQ